MNLFSPEIRLSYFAVTATAQYAGLLKESRMEYIDATVLDRKSGRSGFPASR
jgi:hypothetical protein